MKTAVLTLDIGSSSLRCSAYEDPDTVLVSKSLERRSVVGGKIVLYSKNHNASILDEIDKLVDQVLAQLDGYKVNMVGFTCFSMNLVGVNDKGELIGEEATMSYACQDDNVLEEVETLKQSLGRISSEELYQRTGAPLHASYALPQLRVYKGQVAYRWQTLASACLSRWMGKTELPISYTEASWMGLLNFVTCEYEQRVLDLLDAKTVEALPELADFDTEDLSIPRESEYYKRWPKLHGARLFLGTCDGACANIGSKCNLSNRIACTIGTSAAARVCLPIPRGKSIPLQSGLFCYRIDRKRLLVGGALTDGGSVIEWLIQLLNLKDASSPEFQDCLAEVEVLMQQQTDNGRSLVTVAPFLSGERSTGFRSGAQGTIHGLTRDTTPAHLLKASLEGVTLRLVSIIERIRSVAASSDIQIVCSGKALEVNSLWRTMLADASGLPVVLDDTTKEGTSRGVVCLMTGVESEEIDTTKTIFPNTSTILYWEQAARKQERLIDAVSPLYTK